MAKKLLAVLKRNNLTEDLLLPKQNEVNSPTFFYGIFHYVVVVQKVKEFFADGKKPADFTDQVEFAPILDHCLMQRIKVIEYFDAAIERMLERLMFRSDELDVPIDNEMRWWVFTYSRYFVFYSCPLTIRSRVPTRKRSPRCSEPGARFRALLGVRLSQSVGGAPLLLVRCFGTYYSNLSVSYPVRNDGYQMSVWHPVFQKTSIAHPVGTLSVK